MNQITVKEIFMQIPFRWSLIFLAVTWLALNAGCETTEPRQELAWAPVPIADLPSVAGTWEGIMRRVPHQKRNDLVTIVIAPDGQFKFTSVRTIGVMSGEGQFALTNGKLTFSSERGTIDATLLEAKGQRMLKAAARASDGTEYNSELTQVR
jgi:hypothetical protein